MRFLFLTQYFPPEVGAAQTRLFSVAKTLVELGHEVTVVTAMPNYPRGRVEPGYRFKLFKRERLGEIDVHRSFILPIKHTDFRRLIAYLSFQASSFPVLIRLATRDAVDYVFVESPPLFLGLSAALLKKLMHVPFIFNVSDLWPDWAVAVGAIAPGGFQHRIGLALERMIYRRAAFVNVVVHAMRPVITGRGVPVERILFLPNGVDVDQFPVGDVPVRSERAKSLIAQAGGRPIILYAGTHGLYHGLDVVLEAAARLAERRDVLFAFVGDGSEKSRLIARASQLKLRNVSFFAAVPQLEVPDLLRVSKIAVSVLRIPSRAAKILPAMAAQRPIVYAGVGEGADLVRQAGCGIVVESANAEQLSEATDWLLSHPEEADEMGRNGRDFAKRNLTWRTLVTDWLEELTAPRRLVEVNRGFQPADS